MILAANELFFYGEGLLYPLFTLTFFKFIIGLILTSTIELDFYKVSPPTIFPVLECVCKLDNWLLFLLWLAMDT